MKILVCGGRHYSDKEKVFQALDYLHANKPISVIIHGAAPGADTLADKWAKDRGITLDPYPAAWDIYGKAAGPLRNTKMITEGLPDGVVAFPGDTGTRDMTNQATKAGIKVWRPFG